MQHGSAVGSPAITHACRSCGGGLHPFVDLGLSPLCESYPTAADLVGGEMFHPLDVRVCGSCGLAQLPEYVSAASIFSEYAYFSSYSHSWVAHAGAFVAMAQARFGLGPDSFVVEVASNDGYLLQHAVARGIPCLGIEPAANVAEAAEALGVPTRVAFFGRAFAQLMVDDDELADLVVGNNVLAQVPDLNDFVAGLRMILRPEGVVTLEFPHLVRLIEGNQFDTIYHEHFSYFSLASVEFLFHAHGLRVFDVEELTTHGGSLRVFGCRAESAHAEQPAMARLRDAETAAGLQDLATYAAFGQRVVQTKHKLLSLLIELKRQGRRIVGYGAPGKGNTLLNYCGIRSDFLDFTVDRSTYKQGRFLPGTRIPILAPAALDAARPDYVLILPWNIQNEIMAQLAHIAEWGGQFIVPVPEPTIIGAAAKLEAVS